VVFLKYRGGIFENIPEKCGIFVICRTIYLTRCQLKCLHEDSGKKGDLHISAHLGDAYLTSSEQGPDRRAEPSHGVPLDRALRDGQVRRPLLGCGQHGGRFGKRAYPQAHAFVGEERPNVYY